MTILTDITYKSIKRFSTNKGKISESIPEYRMMIWKDRIKTDDLQSYKNQIITEHLVNLRFLPKSWESALSIPIFF